MMEPDKWADWVLDRGHGGLSEEERSDLAYLIPIRDRVLTNARIREGDTLLDVGTGEGLIAFAALDHVAEGKVILSDISKPLLDHCRSLAERAGVLDRVGFVQASADDLSPIADQDVDVVTTRSVLIYVDRKDVAFQEFHRVLRPGGRLSLFEPINRYFEAPEDDFWGFDASPVRELVAKMNAYEGRNGDDASEDDPMMNFGERDLFEFAKGPVSSKCMSSSTWITSREAGSRIGTLCSGPLETPTHTPCERSSMERSHRRKRRISSRT
jgi:arsenite methyltransferase